MPFTLAHPAIVTPLRRRGLLLSALVVGSMTPDFGFYLALGRLGDRSHHSIADLFTFCIPTGLLALWIFHRILKRPLLSLLPAFLQRRLEPYATPFTFGPWRRFVVILASLIVGAVSHLVWDFFCHVQGWHGWPLQVLTTPLLRHTPVGSIRVVEGIHVLFSLAGLSILAAQIAHAVAATPALRPPTHLSIPREPSRGILGIAALVGLAVMSFCAAAAGSFLLAHPFTDPQARRLAVYHTVVLTVTLFCTGLILISLALHTRRILQRAGNPNRSAP